MTPREALTKASQIIDQVRARLDAPVSPDAMPYMRALRKVADRHHPMWDFAAGQLFCAECGFWNSGEPVNWPCPTFRDIASACSIEVGA